MMAASVALLYLAVTAIIQTTSAEDEARYVEHPAHQDLMPTDDAYFAWRCNDDCEGPVTIEIHGDDFDGTATADWSDSSTTLPPSFLPAMRPEETSVFTFSLYSSTRIDGDDFGIGVFNSKFSLFAPTPTTETVTQTKTVTTTSDMTQTAETSQIPSQGLNEEEDEGTEDSEPDTGGLSTGGKAGIGVGVAVGAILLAAGAFLVVRRRKRVETRMIREIPATSSVNLPGPGPGFTPNQANTTASGQTYEMRG